MDEMKEEASPVRLGPPPPLVAEKTSTESRAFDRTEPTEIVIGIVGPIGTQNDKVIELITSRLKLIGYETVAIRISQEIIPDLSGKTVPTGGAFEHASSLIQLGNELRSKSKENGILALAAAAKISQQRKKDDKGDPIVDGKTAYIISSLKHPSEVIELRHIYPRGFYLFAIHTNQDRRIQFLMERGMSKSEAESLMTTDEGEEEKQYGQHTRDTFQMGDFFVHHEKNEDKLKNSIWRILDLIFGCPTITPTFDEYAMFMASAASLRSADLSRQVGAVIAKQSEILSTGANDCPAAGGGLYWPKYSEKANAIVDEPQGRDYTRGVDSNAAEKAKIIDSVLRRAPEGTDKKTLREVLEASPIKDITGYGRVVHAEMEAIISCARNALSCRGATMYCTTFPCHNCAKHIIAAGIERVFFIEPYPKSKAAEYHSDSIKVEPQSIRDRKRDSAETPEESKIVVDFRPFIGVGPRQFFDLFSMTLSSGYLLTRKDSTGYVAQWTPDHASVRVQMYPLSYLELEAVALSRLEKFLTKPQ